MRLISQHYGILILVCRCMDGKEATPLEAIESDSKSWCKESEL